eukprot:CAMPEP_0173410740 /NCGR_PEP_ID=MMETSP1356-20130122/75312_1 /TAXON_ID=77927 ORGANISM="Hemiselmis virescens, Strain PCC157" /NCGR_SAMPLE_ID=MMETSP1356 /ASSEMBLY_ACC=CAM_ASM_000847 /LENGTH=36 /DNA_ID= /DNA_START= /DNA_END= /DNA_ORIENTATION=
MASTIPRGTMLGGLSSSCFATPLCCDMGIICCWLGV